MLLSILVTASSALAPSSAPVPTLESSFASNTSLEIEWESGRLTRSLARAKDENKPVFVYFWASSSQQCQKTWTDSITTNNGQLALEQFVCFSAPVEDANTAKLVQQYNISTLPTMLILTPSGEPEDALLGYHSEGLLVNDLARILNGVDTVSSRRNAAEAAPKDLDLRFALAAKLAHVGSQDESQQLFDSIKAEDPKGSTVVAARLHLWEVMNKISESADDPGDQATYDLKPMYSYMSKIKPDEIVVEGWDWIGEIERAKGNQTKVCKAMRKAWPHMVSDNQTMRWGLSAVLYHWDNRDDLGKSEKAFALKVALRCQELEIEQLDPEYEGETEERDQAVLDVLGRAYLINGRKREALSTIEASIEKNGSTPEREQFRELCGAGKS